MYHLISSYRSVFSKDVSLKLQTVNSLESLVVPVLVNQLYLICLPHFIFQQKEKLMLMEFLSKVCQKVPSGKDIMGGSTCNVI